MKILRVLLSLFIVCMSFSGCFSSKAPLEFYVVDFTKQETFKYLADKFCAENGGRYKVNIVCISAPKTYLLDRILKNEVPDIIAMDGDSIFTELVRGNYLLEVKNKKYLKNISQKYIDMVLRINGDRSDRLFGIPYAVNASGIIYNKKIFRENNIEPPRTWTELENVCRKLKSAGIPAFEMSYDDEWTTLPPWNNLVPILAPHRFPIDRNNGRTTFSETHREVLRKYAFLLDYTQGSEAFSTNYIDAIDNMAAGEAAMMINGNWAIPFLKRANPDIEIDSIPFPSCDIEERNTVNSGVDIVLTVSAASKNKRLAKKFLEFMIRPENSQAYIDRQYSFSAVSGVTQEDVAVAGLKKALHEERISDFPDHYYPAGFDLASLLTEFAQNKEKRIPDEQNITAILLKCDTEYDVLLKNLEARRPD